jgi:NAD(P)-dependent dehydrogenase (short-subunit alcohol dehydrogenase family)
VPADLDRTAAVSHQLAVEAAALLGRVDILANNAGIYPPSTTATTDECSTSTAAGRGWP